MWWRGLLLVWFLLWLSYPCRGFAQSLAGPRLARGDELTFVGEVIEGSEKLGQRFRKAHDLEIQLFVLETTTEASTCAVLTKLKPRRSEREGVNGKLIMASAVAERQSASVHLEFVKVDQRGRVSVYQLAGKPPYIFNQSSRITENAGPPWDGPPNVELGFFVPLPIQSVVPQTTWGHAEPGKPPMVYHAKGVAIARGARCLEISGEQRSDGWDRPTEVNHGTRRLESLIVPPAEGYAVRVERRIEHRQRKEPTNWVEVRYELRASLRHNTTSQASLRRDLAWAYFWQEEFDALVSQQASQIEFQNQLIKLENYLAEASHGSARELLDGLQSRFALAAAGQVPPRLAKPLTYQRAPLQVGLPAPDFLVPRAKELSQVRLSEFRGKPVVLGFYRPGSKTSVGTRQLLQAVHDYHPERVVVVGLAIHESAATTTAEYDQAKQSFLLARGDSLIATYELSTYPRFYLVDTTGTLSAEFRGIGEETGYLVHTALVKLLPSTEPGQP